MFSLPNSENTYVFLCVSHHNGEQALLLWCLRSKVSKSQLFYTVPLGNVFKTKCFIMCSLQIVAFWVCSIVLSVKEPYKVRLRIVFVHMNSPNRYIYRCNLLPYQTHYVFFLTCMGKTLAKWKQQSRSGGADHRDRFTLCVCFCVFPSLMQTENPIRSEISVREQKLGNLQKLLHKRLSNNYIERIKPT